MRDEQWLLGGCLQLFSRLQKTLAGRIMHVRTEPSTYM
jgi:hypothetical protein